MFFDDNHLPRAEVIRAAKKQGQIERERDQAETDRYNGAIMRRDEQLSRFLMVYTKLAEAEREAFVDRALAAGRGLIAATTIGTVCAIGAAQPRLSSEVE